jgi:Zn-dependent peptidase ImmA (M78 family)
MPDFPTSGEMAARRVLEECGLDDPTELPMKEIILGRKAFYQEIPLNGKDGEIVSFGRRSVITINSSIRPLTRKRFAAAHELGHFEMHRDLTKIFLDTNSEMSNWCEQAGLEREANEFAAEFLMPSGLFHEECRGMKFGPSVIDHLAHRFQVSKMAALLHFVNRGNHPICVVYCKSNRLNWWRMSPQFEHYPKLIQYAHPPIESLTYKLFMTRNESFGDVQEREVLKSTWFELARSERDKIFYEYCLFSRAYDYSISVLWEE